MKKDNVSGVGLTGKLCKHTKVRYKFRAEL